MSWREAYRWRRRRSGAPFKHDIINPHSGGSIVQNPPLLIDPFVEHNAIRPVQLGLGRINGDRNMRPAVGSSGGYIRYDDGRPHLAGRTATQLNIKPRDASTEITGSCPGLNTGCPRLFVRSVGQVERSLNWSIVMSDVLSHRMSNCHDLYWEKLMVPGEVYHGLPPLRQI